MRKRAQMVAQLPHPRSAELPSMVIDVPAELQFCVDAGACAAAYFCADITKVGLHDHIAVSMHAFMLSLESSIVAASPKNGQWLCERKQHCIDAFGAGYLGLVQQELRLF